GRVHDPRLPLQGAGPVRRHPRDLRGHPMDEADRPDLPAAPARRRLTRLSADLRPSLPDLRRSGSRRRAEAARRGRGQDGAMDVHPASVPPVDSSRPFGAHLRMSWWRPLLILPILAVAMFGLQIALTMLVVLVEVLAFGRDPADTTL